MSYYRGTVTLSSTGLVTPNIGFQPVGYKISVGQKFGINDTQYMHTAIGGSDGTRQHVIAGFQDATGRQTFTISGKVIVQYERSGGVITSVLDASHDSMQPLGPRLNVAIANANYQVVLEAWN